MNIKFKTVALLAVLCLPVAGCQKDQVDNPVEYAEPSSAAIKATYSINGTQYTVLLEDEAAWNAFIEKMLALTREGYEVSISRGDSLTSRPTKETITYTTTSEQDALQWTNTMANLGYTVTMTYNKKTGIYTCIAIK